MTMRVAVAADHAGFPYKAGMIHALKADGHEVFDLGTDSDAPADYPDFARAVGVAVREGRVDAGVIICGSGAGVSIAANKLRGVRAALCHDVFTARQAREDDDANVLCLGARVIAEDFAITLARAFLGARFSGAERHRRRLEKVLALERAEMGEGAAVDTHAIAPAEAAIAHLESIDAGRRLWAEDPAPWTTAATTRAAILNRLGWLRAPQEMRRHVADLERFAAEVRGEGITDVVLFGMGGSSLAPEVLHAALGAAPGHPALTVLDTTDPGAIRATLRRLALPRTLFLVSSKSGTTPEMLALYRFFRAETDKAVGDDARAGGHFVAITDAGTPLEKLASESGFRRTFLNDPRIGGRFSALSFFGLVPAALVGADLGRLLDRAAAMAASCGAEVPVRENPGLRLGATLAGLAQAGRAKVTLMLSPGVRALGIWLEQLLTESTGELGRGLVVVDDEPLGVPDAYGTDRVFVAVRLGRDEALDATAAALESAGHPVIRVTMSDAYDVPAEFFRWEVATAAAGIVLGLNPFDEPNVAQAKDATTTALARFLETGRLPEWPSDSVDELARVLSEARPGDYIGLLAYLTPAEATTTALQKMRAMLRDRTRLATTMGYGPRYLHSTGQLHKGGPPTPILVLFTAAHEELPIPGERYGFATLEMAQALGDLATLRAAQRRALWLPLDGAPVDALARVTSTLERKVH
ncbi:MAG: RpiB/LacA/LacB family sugar-phosphate isomerase [Candidatus Rokubacteria bacterium]|nr:RpiB/LacA/LacB family sugar-phosphate isomerase [Candidatus Rokubacteria bacterium]